MLVHLILVFIELAFILSVPFFVFFVGAGCVAYSCVVALVLSIICRGLNGGNSGRIILSDPDILEGFDKKEGEVWVFVNGVAVG
jgi:hypothetical protein